MTLDVTKYVGERAGMTLDMTKLKYVGERAEMWMPGCHLVSSTSHWEQRPAAQNIRFVLNKSRATNMC